MDKSPDAFRTISEVAADLDVPQHVLRFWESKFSQIRPMKRGGGRRYYRPGDVELLRGIRHLLYGEGYTIRGVQKLLKERGVSSVAGLAKTLEPAQSDGATLDDSLLDPSSAAPIPVGGQASGLLDLEPDAEPDYLRRREFSGQAALDDGEWHSADDVEEAVPPVTGHAVSRVLGEGECELLRAALEDLAEIRRLLTEGTE